MKYILPLAGATLCPPAGEHSNIKSCQLFQNAEAKQNRLYNTTGDRNKAYVNFLENLHEMEEVQKKFIGAKFSLDGPFFDWSIAEWKARNNLKYKDYDEKKHKDHFISPDALKNIEDAEFSWVKLGGVNPVQDQGSCGSCWAFSSVANIEGVHFHQTQNLLKLSESELVDCMDSDNGCNGGLPSYTDDELEKKHMGLELESAYSYHPVDGRCQYDPSKAKVFVVSYGVLAQGREDLMANVLYTYGPLSVGVNADPLQYYTGGVLNPSTEEDCDPSGVDHAVTVTGFGNEGTVPYWEVRNSWGPDWALQGYFHIVRNKNACGISVIVSSVTKTAVNSQAQEIVA